MYPFPLIILFDLQNYYEVIENPVDLSNIRQNLEAGTYKDPTEFARDMRLMFSNSKSYNTNKRSRIYAMTLRLSAMFSERINDILTTWKTAMKQHRKRHPNRYEENRHTGEVTLF